MNTLTGRKLKELYDLLFNHFGPQYWWPAENELEMMVGAILTQNTNWNNVEKAISNLKKENLLSIDSLQSLSIKKLAETIRPAGYFNIKAARLKNLINFITERYNGDMELLLKEDTYKLRNGLLGVKGVGPETADSIILYGARRPLFVVDNYTYRVLNSHQMVDDQAGYYEIQELLMDNLHNNVEFFNEFHALLVQTGKNYCRKKPSCGLCPLEKW